MNYTKKEREYYNMQRDRTCERLGITKNQYNHLRRQGEKLRKLYEDNCNGLVASQLEYELLENELALELYSYMRKNHINLYSYFQTDPRGATLYLDMDSINDNNYTNACCIY